MLIMNMKEKVAIDETANALQVINVLSTRLRQGLGKSGQRAAENTSWPPVCSAVELTLLSLISEAGLRLLRAAPRCSPLSYRAWRTAHRASRARRLSPGR